MNMILSPERLSGRDDVTSDKVNFRSDINIRLAFEKQNQKKKQEIKNLRGS